MEISKCEERLKNILTYFKNNNEVKIKSDIFIKDIETVLNALEEARKYIGKFIPISEDGIIMSLRQQEHLLKILGDE